MAHVLWGRNTSSIPRLSFLRCPPDQVVWFLESPERYHVLLLHYDERKRGSVPCLGEQCQLCPLESFQHCYTGALRWDKDMNRWVRTIVDVGSPGLGLASMDLVGHASKIGRRKKNDSRSALIFGGTVEVKAHNVPQAVIPFDVRPSLMRRWSLFDEANELAREPYYEQQRLYLLAAQDDIPTA